MLLPSVFSEDLFSDFGRMLDFPKPITSNLMRTDVKKTDRGYELDIDLPGYKKDQIQAELLDGYLNITATKNDEKEETGKDGSYIRRERYSGRMSRSFYVGDTLTQEDIEAKYEDGILSLVIPEKKPAEPVKKLVHIA